MSFLETPRFPLPVGWGASSHPRYNTNVLRLESGHEKRNQVWSYALNRYNVALGVRSEADLESLIEFFHAVAGRAHGFRFKDRWDYKSTDINSSPDAEDQAMSYIDGSQSNWQLTKTYTKGALSQTREIKKPVAGTVLVAVNGALQTQGSDYTIDTTTGIVEFSTGSIPDPVSDTVTAGYEFDVPCRFDTDEIPITLETYRAGSASVMVTEIRV